MRDAKDRYTDLEVAAVESHFADCECPARDEAELQALLDTFEAAGVVLGVRLDRVQSEIEAQLVGLGAFLWRRFPRLCRVTLRVVAALLRLVNWPTDD